MWALNSQYRIHKELALNGMASYFHNWTCLSQCLWLFMNNDFRSLISYMRNLSLENTLRKHLLCIHQNNLTMAMPLKRIHRFQQYFFPFIFAAISALGFSINPILLIWMFRQITQFRFTLKLSGAATAESPLPSQWSAVALLHPSDYPHIQDIHSACLCQHFNDDHCLTL